jgi:ATPase subunit of ABC transporter with duplicated ATPase domains
VVRITDLAFSYASRPVFRNLCLSFADGWTALAGANGAGKSTLLKLISGALLPSSGSVSCGGSVLVCPQLCETVPECFFDGEILNSGEFFSLLAKLEIGGDWIERWDTLSGGEQKRCLIADTLIRKPDVLILDEPANHIDRKTMRLLAAALKEFEGTGIVVSHNLAFLDELAGETVLLVPERDNGSRAFVFAVPPLAALAEFEKLQAGKRRQKAMLGAAAARLEQAQKTAVSEAERDKRRRMSKRNLAVHDSDTRAKINLARLSGRDTTGGKKAVALAASLARAEAELAGADAVGLRKTGAGLRGVRSERAVLYFLERGETALGEESGLTLEHPDLEIRNDSRIVILGGNGSGKTSLLAHIAGTINIEGLALMALPQEISRTEHDALLSRLREMSEDEKGTVLSIVYRLGSEAEALLAARDLSPGETRKLCFAFAMLRGVSLLILDEPTNHMDAVSVMALIDALNEFEGAVLMVSHDIIFAQKTGAVFWNITRNGNRSRLVIDTIPR